MRKYGRHGKGESKVTNSVFRYPYPWTDVNVAYDLDVYSDEFIPGAEPERRSGIDRRKFTYTAHIPERRRGRDRRRRLVEV